jgi:hypothetical protein
VRITNLSGMSIRSYNRDLNASFELEPLTLGKPGSEKIIIIQETP